MLVGGQVSDSPVSFPQKHSNGGRPLTTGPQDQRRKTAHVQLVRQLEGRIHPAVTVGEAGREADGVVRLRLQIEPAVGRNVRLPASRFAKRQPNLLGVSRQLLGDRRLADQTDGQRQRSLRNVARGPHGDCDVIAARERFAQVHLPDRLGKAGRRHADGTRVLAGDAHGGVAGIQGQAEFGGLFAQVERADRKPRLARSSPKTRYPAVSGFKAAGSDCQRRTIGEGDSRRGGGLWPNFHNRIASVCVSSRASPTPARTKRTPSRRPAELRPPRRFDFASVQCLGRSTGRSPTTAVCAVPAAAVNTATASCWSPNTRAAGTDSPSRRSPKYCLPAKTRAAWAYAAKDRSGFPSGPACQNYSRSPRKTDTRRQSSGRRRRPALRSPCA